MPAKRIIPCLDVTDGRVVKGVKFKDLRDAGDPAELAATYDREGADEIVFLDITASSDARKILLGVVERTADQVFIPLTVGGGVRSVEDMAELLTHGADKVSVNTAALDDPDLITRCAEIFGSQCVVLAIDARRRAPGAGQAQGAPSDWEVFSHGGRRATSRDAIEWAVLGEKLGAFSRARVSLRRRAVIQPARLRAEPRGSPHTAPVQDHHSLDGGHRRTAQRVPTGKAGPLLYSRFAPGRRARGIRGFNIATGGSRPRNYCRAVVEPAPTLGRRTRFPFRAFCLTEFR